MRLATVVMCLLIASACFGQIHDQGGTRNAVTLGDTVGVLGASIPEGLGLDNDESITVQSFVEPFVTATEVQKIIDSALECIDTKKMERGTESEKQECYKAMNRLRDLSVRLREMNGEK